MRRIIDTFLRYQIKKLQIRYQTWKNRRDITSAYKSRRTLLPSIGQNAPRSLSYIVMILAGVAAVILASSIPYDRLVTLTNRLFNHGRQKTHHSPAGIVENTAEAEPLPETIVDADEKVFHDSLFLSSWHPPQTMKHVIVANKASSFFHLLTQEKNGSWSIRNAYLMASGKRKGRKQNEGDLRTPEGIYYIVGRIEGRELSSIYGPFAYILDYPNIVDIEAGRTGQGIWIHGTDEDSSRVTTRGCLVLGNSDLLELQRHLKLGIATPVVIVDVRNLSNPAALPDYDLLLAERRKVLSQYAALQREFASFLYTWKSSWESRDIKNYSQFYDSTSFVSENLSWEAWLARKLFTFERYQKIDVAIRYLLVASASDSTATLQFMQHYSSNLNQMSNAKQLSLRKIDGFWRIYHEKTFPNEELYP